MTLTSFGGEKRGIKMNGIGRPLAIGLSAAIMGLSSAALAADAGRMFFEGDMVVSPPKGATGAHCVLASQFRRNDRVVFRVRVLNQNGDPVTDKDVKSMEIKLSSGESIAMRYGGHPHSKPLDNFWSAGWTVPTDYPAGSMSYQVIATTASGDTQSWAPFNVAASQLTVLNEAAEVAK